MQAKKMTLGVHDTINPPEAGSKQLVLWMQITEAGQKAIAE
jgi:hypothetical protein